MKSSINTK